VTEANTIIPSPEQLSFIVRILAVGAPDLFRDAIAKRFLPCGAYPQ
jgi:hypothetical protein